MIDQAINLLKQMHKETKYSKFRLDENKLRSTLEHLIEKKQFIRVSDDAIMIGVIEETFFGPDLIANDVLLYVSEKKRGLGIAESLIEEFKRWSIGNGAVSCIIGQTTGVYKNQFKALMRKVDAKQIGVVCEVF